MRRAGFTLIEMLVALAITLVMMAAVVSLFGVVAESVSNSRAGIEMSDRLRGAHNRIQSDLNGATATMRPPLRPESDLGYFEYIEGQHFDGATGLPLDIFGDADDALMLTVRRNPPFVGKLNGVAIESPLAEVVYFMVQNGPIIDATQTPPVRLFTLYRRVLLIAPGVAPTIANPSDHYYDDNDISVRYEEPPPSLTPTLIPNTLGDLTKRENRFAHTGTGTVAYGEFPFPIRIDASLPSGWPGLPGPPRRPTENAFLLPGEDELVGDDVLLGNVLAFDVQAFDPRAPLFVSDTTPLEPRDPGWETKAMAWRDAGYPYVSPPGPADPLQPIGFGAYVDLAYGVPLNLNPPDPLVPDFHREAFGLTKLARNIYDTWSLHYEADGIHNDSNTAGGDFGSNGLDDGPPPNPNGIVDDVTEFDTLPPYATPLRGIRVTLRVYEPSSKQVREAIVLQSFQPR